MFVKTTDRGSVDTALSELQRHSWSESVAWHLLPGVPIAVAYVGLAYLFTQRFGLPNVYALFAVVTFVEIPLLIFLLRRFRTDDGPLLRSVALFPLRLSQPLWVWLAIGIPFTLYSFFANVALVGPVDAAVRSNVFGFLPDWFVLNFSGGGIMAVRESSPVLFFVFYAMSVVGFIGGSYLQELYFRGVLLPRMPDAGVGTPVANAALFSLFHLTSPWALFGRMLFLLPWSIIVWWRKSLNLGILMHVGMAVISATLGAIFMFGR